uniref:Ig-like domain-containing protein n=1 Tax=Lates calcarifer TaxID=8187 RepID=A0A4W6D6T1_LATCA
SVTFICDMKEGKDTDWYYRISRDDQELLSWRINKDNTLYLQSSAYSGKCQCFGEHKSTHVSKNSNIVSLTVSDDKPRATLTPGPTTIPVGGSVTLTCSVEGSAGWKYEWFRSSGSSHTLLVISNVRVSVTLQHSWPQIFTGETITVRCEIQGGGDTEWEYEWRTTSSVKPPNQHEYRIYYASSSHSGNYECRGRKKSSQQSSTKWSDSFNLTVYDNLHPAASLTVNPDRVQHFTSDSVSLSCEGNSTEWRVKRFNEHGYQSDCSYWGRMTGSICNISSLWYTDTLVYWCESGSGEFSNAVNITVQGDGIILVSPANPVAEGQSVTLGCKLRTENVVSNVCFYHNDKLIQNDTTGELTISAVSKSDEGFYKCQWSGKESPQSWMSVKAVSRPESSQFPVLLIVGLVCGILLIILLLLLVCYRKSKGEISSL